MNKGNIRIRPATANDLDAITEIYADAVTNGTASYELEAPSRADMAARFETLAAGGHPYLVAEIAGRVAGYAYAGPFRPRPAYRFVVEDSIYVAPDAKGKGLGRMLLERLIAETRRLGFRQVKKITAARVKGRRLCYGGGVVWHHQDMRSKNSCRCSHGGAFSVTLTLKMIPPHCHTIRDGAHVVEVRKLRKSHQRPGSVR